MIVIPRKRDEAVVIGEDIVVTVLEIRGDRVRLGIDYPRDVVVRRGEVCTAMEKATEPPRFR